MMYSARSRLWIKIHARALSGSDNDNNNNNNEWYPTRYYTEFCTHVKFVQYIILTYLPSTLTHYAYIIILLLLLLWTYTNMRILCAISHNYLALPVIYIRGRPRRALRHRRRRQRVAHEHRTTHAHTTTSEITHDGGSRGGHRSLCECRTFVCRDRFWVFFNIFIKGKYFYTFLRLVIYVCYFSMRYYNFFSRFCQISKNKTWYKNTTLV